MPDHVPCEVVNSGQPTRKDNSPTYVCGGTVQLDSSAEVPSRGQRVLQVQRTALHAITPQSLTEGFSNLIPNLEVVTSLPSCLDEDLRKLPVRNLWVCSVRYRYSRYRYGCRTELTEVSGTGIDVVPNLPKLPVPVLMSSRTYQSSRCRY